MHNLLLALHILAAVFGIGPLAHGAATAARGVRHADATATAASARLARIFGYTSVLVVVLGMSLVRPKWDAEFGNTWVWVSLLLWLLASVLVFAVLVPALNRATELITAGDPVGSLTVRVAASGNAVATIYAVIVFLMVYRTGG